MSQPHENPPRPRWAGLLALSLSAVAGGVAGYLLKERIAMALASLTKLRDDAKTFLTSAKADAEKTKADLAERDAKIADLTAQLADATDTADDEAVIAEIEALFAPPADPTTPEPPPTETPAPEPAPA